MTENTKASDWAAARGGKWRLHLAGMESMLRPVDEPLIRALRLQGPSRVADVGCGGGGTSVEIHRRAPAGSAVHGFDVSPALVEWARERARSEDRGIAFEVADVSTARPGEPFDRLVSRFGIMFFEDPPAAFANLAHWLAPGGRFAFAVWGPVAENPWMTSARDTVAAVVDVPTPAPDAPGAFRYGEIDGLIRLLERAGFADTEVQEWRAPIAIGGGLPAPQAAQFALAAFSSFGELLAAAGDEARAGAQRALTERLSRHETAGVVRMNACVRIVTGGAPSASA
jgi:SAM-dependent methyltransferase